jgi:long-chain acyl-CoA synthetase
MPHVHDTVVHMLAEAAVRAPAGIALRCDGESLRYDELLHAVAGFARHLAARGIGRGDRVAVLLGNGIEIAVTLYGVHALGAQAVPVNPAYTARELGEILADAAPHCLVAGSAQAEIAVALAAQAGAGTPVLWDAGLVAARRRWAGDAALTLPVPPPDPGWPATLMYTGGTTGRSKGVEIAHGPMALNVSQREALLPTQAGDERILCVMPMFHSFAMLMCLYSACYARGARASPSTRAPCIRVPQRRQAWCRRPSRLLPGTDPSACRLRSR